MKISKLVERLETWKTMMGDLDVALHVRTNDPTLSQSGIDGIVKETVKKEEGMITKIVIFGGDVPWMRK